MASFRKRFRTGRAKTALLLALMSSFLFITGFDLPFEKHKWIIADCAVGEMAFHQWQEVYITEEDEQGFSHFTYEGRDYALPGSFLWNAYEFTSRANMKAAGISEIGVVDNDRELIMIGDSRTYFMCGTMVDPGCSWIAGCGRGLDWAKAIVVPVLEEEDFTGKQILIMLGINDLCWNPDPEGTARRYLDFYGETAAKWQEKGADIYILGLTPVLDSPMLTNQRVKRFNAYMRENLPENFHYLEISDPGYRYFDILHYTPDTNIRLHQAIMEAFTQAKNAGESEEENGRAEDLF